MFAVLTLPLAHWIGRRMAGRVVGFGGALLLAFSDMFSDEPGTPARGSIDAGEQMSRHRAVAAGLTIRDRLRVCLRFDGSLP